MVRAKNTGAAMTTKRGILANIGALPDCRLLMGVTQRIIPGANFVSRLLSSNADPVKIAPRARGWHQLDCGNQTFRTSQKGRDSPIAGSQQADMPSGR